MTVKILIGDALTRLKELPDEYIHCCVCSPPYYGLRDYGTAQWEGGDVGCDHAAAKRAIGNSPSAKSTLTTTNNGRGPLPGDKFSAGSQFGYAQNCPCGARRIDQQIGLENSPDAYVAALVSVFREVRRVLRKDATLWLNIGDSYAGGGGFSPNAPSNLAGSKQTTQGGAKPGGIRPRADIKAKDLVGIPWLLAFALRSDGWYLRQDIIWSKPNPMPESVTDRCTKAHEYLFLLTKSERYFWDAEAIKEPASYDPENTKFPDGWDTAEGGHGAFHRNGREKGRKSGNKTHKYVEAYDGAESEEHRTKAGLLKIAETAYPVRNKRSVWTVATAPYSEAHFATFPPALIEPCIKAGCPPLGTVLDPFGGAGTTGLVADRLGRNAILIELNPAYAAMAKRRIEGDAPLFTEVA